jgi:hypothetical protein
LISQTESVGSAERFSVNIDDDGGVETMLTKKERQTNLKNTEIMKWDKRSSA